MLDFGWPELLLIIAIAVFVIGPDEIPAIMQGLGRIVRRIQYVKFALSRQFDDFMREHDLDEMRGEALRRETDPSITPESEKDADGI